MSGLAGSPYAQQNSHQLADMRANAPREAGVMERIDGIAIGLKELNHKLLSFGARLSGGAQGGGEEASHPPGIASALSAAESRLRECHQLVDALHKAF